MLLTRFFPGKKIKGTAEEVLKRIHGFFPLRLEHEVNRQRGYAFDSGDEGFSHKREETTT